MIDIKFLREQPEKVRDGARRKGVGVDVDRILALDNGRKKFLSEFEALRVVQKKEGESLRSLQGEEKVKKQAELKELSEKLKELEKYAKEAEENVNVLLREIPNLPHESVPEGKDETENVILRTWNEPVKFSFKPKDHIELGEALSLIDTKRAAKISGTRFYYLMNEAVLMEFALVQWVMQILVKEGFQPVIPPVLAREEIFYDMGYLPHSDVESYKTVLDELRLAATSEHTIGPLYKDEILDEKMMPQRFAGFSTCFRREAGSYGKDIKGILRVHQFDKVEMFSFTKPEDSWNEHEKILSIEERIMQELKIPYRVVLMCSGDLGMPAAKKYDIEAWMPGQNSYRETHSCSNCTDFQSRRLNMRYRSAEDKKIHFMHTLNGTACAVGRMLIAIFENYQQEDGSIVVPEVLRPFMNTDIIKEKK